MDPTAKRPGSGFFLQVGLVLLLAVAGAGASLPLVRCPNCGGPVWQVPEKCFRCNDRRMISLIDRWRRGDSHWVEWEGDAVSTISLDGFAVTKKKRALALLGIRPGDILTTSKVEAATLALMQTNDYIDVQLYGVKEPQSRGKVILKLFVMEKSTALLDDPGSPDD